MKQETGTTLDAAALAADYAEDLVVGTVREVHRAVAGRVYGVSDWANGGGPTVGHLMHDGISAVVYGGISAGFRAGALGLRTASRAGLGCGPFEATRQGRFVNAAVNGLIGDRLREDGSPLAFDMGVRVDGRDVRLDDEGLATAFPEAGDSLVVFLHGLVENEDFWFRSAKPRTEARREAPEKISYGERLRAEHGWTPVYLRVNTGLPVAENGVALAALLNALLEHWPVGVRRIALVGHSMGGLIARAACAVATDSATPWTDLVTDVVCLGTPHLGAPLERAAERGAKALGRLPESAPLGRILEYRSVGILNLRHGLAPDVQNLPHARYRLVAATLGRSTRSVSARTVGDLLVPYDSALGYSRNGEEMFPGAETLHVPRADHFDLLNHDDVYAALRQWLAADPRTDRAADPPTQQEASFA